MNIPYLGREKKDAEELNAVLVVMGCQEFVKAVTFVDLGDQLEMDRRLNAAELVILDLDDHNGDIEEIKELIFRISETMTGHGLVVYASGYRMLQTLTECRDHIHAWIRKDEDAQLRGFALRNAIEARQKNPVSSLAQFEPKRYGAVVMADITNYTEVAEIMNEKVLTFTSELFKIAKDLLNEHQGIFYQHTGDGFLAIFPKYDDQSRAQTTDRGVRFCIGFLNQFRPLFQETYEEHLSAKGQTERDAAAGTIRMGLESGEIFFEPSPIDGEHLIAGEAVILATRLTNAIKHNELCIGLQAYNEASVRRQFEEVDYEGKGVTAGHRAFKYQF